MWRRSLEQLRRLGRAFGGGEGFPFSVSYTGLWSSGGLVLLLGNGVCRGVRVGSGGIWGLGSCCILVRGTFRLRGVSS